MKRFIYDQIIDRENLCNMEQEAEVVTGLIENKRNIVIYGPRNYGKTSLIKNVIIPEFKAKHKHAFTFFVDLFDIKDNSSLHTILQRELESSFADVFPATTLIQKTTEFLKNFSPQFSIDPLSSQPIFSLTPSNSRQKQLDLMDIMGVINTISKKHPCLIIFDEFQAIARIEHLDATFRKSFQLLSDVPIIMMGSQKHMLLDLFSSPKAPLANFGVDVEIHPIDYDTYHQYILERYVVDGVAVTMEATRHIQDMMNRVPESINIIADNVLIFAKENNISKVEDIQIINNVINNVVANKKSRFETLLVGLSKGEENVLIAIAKNNGIEKPSSKEFLSSVSVSQSAVGRILTKLLQLGFLERHNGHFIADPLLRIYLMQSR